VPHVTCHMSHVTCHMSHVTCHMSQQYPLPTPPAATCRCLIAPATVWRAGLHPTSCCSRSSCTPAGITGCASHITHHTSHITHHTSHITHHTSHITHHTSHITHHASRITQHAATPFTPAAVRQHERVRPKHAGGAAAVCKCQWLGGCVLVKRAVAAPVPCRHDRSIVA